MTSPEPRSPLQSLRMLIVGLVAVIVVLGFALIVQVITQSRGTAGFAESEQRANALANSTDDCVVCHERSTPGIVEQYGHSTMAAAEVSCQDCHEVSADYANAVEHEGTHVVASPSPAQCEGCHQNEVAQYYSSRHSVPAYVAMIGEDSLAEDYPHLVDMYEAIPEAELGPIAMRNALFDIEGPAITEFACEGCHNIGRPQPDGSVGECQQCHLRHEFSLEQARKPETCNACHIGPDHPQWEIYNESPHGIAYQTGGDTWNWEAEVGTLTVQDFPAPTCATCHFSGFGGTGTTHDVGDRLTWYLFAPISERRPAYQDNMVRMQSVCSECHSEPFIDDFYARADEGVGAINDWVVEGNAIIQPLKDEGIWTDEPFDMEIDFVYFEMWHHWGRTAKFGMWMVGPDYTQWHGAYEMYADLVELREMTEALLEEHNAGGDAEDNNGQSEP